MMVVQFLMRQQLPCIITMELEQNLQCQYDDISHRDSHSSIVLEARLIKNLNSGTQSATIQAAIDNASSETYYNYGIGIMLK